MNTPMSPTHGFPSTNAPPTPLQRSSLKADPHPHAFTEDDLHDIHAKLRARDPPQQTDLDHDLLRSTYYGRRLYPTFDPSYLHACPMRFIRQFEYTAQHNNLPVKAWAKRLNACLHGAAADWAFDEQPLEVPVMAWEKRKRQFLDWALLPAEQEVRRQRLIRFFQTEGDLSSDFAKAFEEHAVGLRDYREDVWVRKCVANMRPAVRTALAEMFPEAMPARFRDLRDALYAADWDLYEVASAPLKVAREPSRSSMCSDLRLSGALTPSNTRVRRQTSSPSSSASLGVAELIRMLTRLSEKERALIMVALERMSFIDEASEQRSRHLTTPRPSTSPRQSLSNRHNSAESSLKYGDLEIASPGLRGRSNVSRAATQIRLRTRPMTSIESRPSRVVASSQEKTARQVSIRRSDSALTSRSVHVGDEFCRESADVDIKSPEFTVLQQNVAPSARRERFRFIRKISNILTHQ